MNPPTLKAMADGAIMNPPTLKAMADGAIINYHKLP